MYSNILKFKGTWRQYQKRVLDHSQQYMLDGHIHIVAAPGSGKTTLGIELIRRLDQKALVLVPSITIREQWAARIEEAFLYPNIDPKDYISQTLKEPKAITIVTYQSIHSAMTKFKGIEKEDDEEKTDDTSIKEEDVDYSQFHVVKKMKEEGVSVLCLDECHHLRSEWWKALQDFKKQMGKMKTIALTATPPYDDKLSMWTRYMDMCGEIDEEITIPELVKEGSLCPHQDYVYFNYPTKEEDQMIKDFEKKAQTKVQELMKNQFLLQAIQTHSALNGHINEDVLLEDPSYIASILIYLQSQNVHFPNRLQRLLGAKRLPAMEEKWMERLLQGFLIDDIDSYACDHHIQDDLLKELKQDGLVEKNKIVFVSNTKIEKMLTNSLGKCQSIKDITFHEYQAMKKDLRLLILTDYIRKEVEKSIGDNTKNVLQLGVLPFFEMLRRENEQKQDTLRLGVLCGTVVIIPSEAKDTLLEIIDGVGTVNFQKLGSLSEDDYVKVTAVGDAHFLTSAVTELFTRGFIQVLIGTKSLLGEGWDAPCVNSLILASFVGSYMLSNQMRGRSIRVWRDHPDKSSNIWHLVCLRPWKDVVSDESGKISQDFSMLERRMENFMGLHDQDNTIENGIQRLSVIQPPFKKKNVEAMNQKMLENSSQRELLKQRWHDSLAIYNKIEIVDETEVPEKMITAIVLFDAIRNAIISFILSVLMVVVTMKTRSYIFGILAGMSFCWLLSHFPKILKMRSPLGRLEGIGKGVRKAMIGQDLLEDSYNKVTVDGDGMNTHCVYLEGGTGREKALFAQCVSEFFDEIDNQRYILVKKKRAKGMDKYFCVPEAFSKKKEDANYFASCMKPYIGEYIPVYTRNEKGREMLLEGRVKAFANKQERCLHKKKVKGALE